MFRAFTRIALALVVLAAPLAVQAADIPPIEYRERVLDNGLRVLSGVDATTPNVTVQVWYGVGSKDDPEGRSGFAHLFEHMMFKTTRNMPSETMDRMTEDVGGFNNASTYDDFTNYFEVIPANHLERLLWAEAERMGSLVVDAEIFNSERDVVKEELRQRILAAPYGRLFGLMIPQASYQEHPYKRPGIGSIAELDAATIDDVRAFHRDYYRPDNAVLIVIGNFQPAELDAWVDKYFAPLKTPDTPLKRVTAVEPPRTGPGVYDGYGPNVPLPAVILTWLGAEAASPDAPALQVLDTILSGGKSSRLYNALVYDQQIAVEALSQADLPQQPGLFAVGAILSSGQTVEAGEAALLAEVARLRDAPPTEAELNEARNEVIAGALRERETVDGRAFALGYAWATQGDPSRANTELADLAAVTAADVQRVAQKYLAENRRMTIRYRPESERPAGEVAAAPAAPPAQAVVFDGEIVTLAPEAERQAPPPVAEPVDPVLPQPAETTLDNGLRVIVARSSDLPLVSAAVIVRAGAWADPKGLAGAMSMTAGMLTEGTTTRTAPQIAQQVEALGATLSSAAGAESSSVGLTVMTDKVAPAFAILSDVVRNPAFAAEELERQTAQALDGLSVAYGDPGQLAAMTASPVIFAGTPFGHAADGTPASLPKLTPETLRSLHGTYFRPDNAILVLTGDIAPEAGFALARQAFGDWTAPASPRPAQPEISPTPARQTLVIDLPGAGQAAVRLAKPTIARSDDAYYPAIVANSVLGGGYSARLNQEIRIKRGLSYGAGSSLSARRSAGAFHAQAQTKNESAPEVVDLIAAEMTRLAAEPVSADELKARKSVLIGGFGRALGTAGGLGGVLGDLAVQDVPLEEIGAYTAKVEAVSAEQVNAFAAARLSPADAAVIVAGDAKLFEAGLRQRAPDLRIIAAEDLDLDSETLTRVD
ncbi:pitrilysin family protein [Phenylobacterium sp.]|uniref:M16 family metallopeptidase n=1 Tax=Phenylobacterium sp. TaxID=1871053 RepID=UPI00272EFE08|nr:pitrilysin family protein [Phenylobacterium sp.]MDP1617572.1 pitrilysin family protein [Phenylobacterium sp.]MDP1989110.1 pitrilysin family protein [Phenylobacterium sp.]